MRESGSRVNNTVPKRRIEAQCHAIGFYERFGFRVDSAEFLEDGIPHVEMVASLVP